MVAFYYCLLILQVYSTGMPFGVQPWHAYTWMLIISFILGMVLMSLFGNSKLQDHEGGESYEKQMAIMREKQIMYERQQIINKQMQLIERFEQAIDETERSTDQYVANIREYRRLKEIDEGWFTWLSTQEVARMYQLEDYLELDEIPDANIAIAIVRQVSEQTLETLSSQLEILEDALHEMDIDKMKDLQKGVNKMQLSGFLRGQTDHMKSKIASTSRALQARSGGTFWKLASFFYNVLMTVISKIV